MPNQSKISTFFSPKPGKKRKRDDEEEEEVTAKKPSLTPDQRSKILDNRRAAIQKRKSKVNYTNLESIMEPTWKDKLQGEFKKSYFTTLKKHLKEEVDKKTVIFPPPHEVYAAFEHCTWDDLKVVIIGQDPYHNHGQAEGLCFSVKKDFKKLPPSLKNMFKEAAKDVGFDHPGHGSLVEWAQQGVLLLNAVLTVTAHKANSHKKFGWMKFTDAVIKLINDEKRGIVFVLWGGQAQKKKKMIDHKRHRVITGVHPSPLSAHRGFFDSKPYSKTNKHLEDLGKDPIKWQITK